MKIKNGGKKSRTPFLALYFLSLLDHVLGFFFMSQHFLLWKSNVFKCPFGTLESHKNKQMRTVSLTHTQHAQRIKAKRGETFFVFVYFLLLAVYIGYWRNADALSGGRHPPLSTPRGPTANTAAAAANKMAAERSRNWFSKKRPLKFISVSSWSRKVLYVRSTYNWCWI